MAVLASNRKTKPRRRQAMSGYTLTEMLVVVAIIGLISAVVIPQTIGQLGKAQNRTAKLQAQSVAAAVELFQGDNGRLPTEEEGLGVLVTRPAGLDSWTGPYIRTQAQLKDSWGRPGIYKQDANGCTISSLGADGKPGGEGADRDISVQ